MAFLLLLGTLIYFHCCVKAFKYNPEVEKFTHLCNIPKVVGTAEIHPLPSYPTIFVYPSSRNTKLQIVGSRQALLSDYPQQLVHLTSSNSYSEGYQQMTLKEYLDMSTLDDKTLGPECSVNSDGICRELPALTNESWYLFGNNYKGVFSRMTKEYILPPCRHCEKIGATSIGIAGPQSGVGFHYHGPGFSEPIIGRKLWILMNGTIFPPGFEANTMIVDWLTELYSSLSESDKASLGLQICTLRPGEVLYFPAMQMHATLNVDYYNLFVSLFLDTQLL